MKSALIFGATGLVGSELIKLLIEDETYSNVHVANRSKKKYSSKKIQEHIVDFDHLEDYSNLFGVDHVFICLGTTIKKAGSKKAFKKVDLELPTLISKLAKGKGSGTLIMISSLGADKNASGFYVRTKGQAEEAIFENGPEKTYVVRPSMLLGDRNEQRIGESIGKFLMKAFDFLLVGKLKKYKGIHAIKVAQAMVFIVNAKPKKSTFESDELIDISVDF